MLNKMEINSLDVNARLGQLMNNYLDEMRDEYISLRRKASRLDRGNPLKMSAKAEKAFEVAAEALQHYFIATDLREAIERKDSGYAIRAERNAIMGKFAPLYLVGDEKKEWHDDTVNIYEEKHGV